MSNASLPVEQAPRTIPDRFVLGLYRHLNIVWCIACFFLTYAIVWITAFDRLTTDSIKEKARIAATMVTLKQADVVTAQKAFDGLQPAITRCDLDFHPIDAGSTRLGSKELSAAMVKSASELSYLTEEDPKFVPTLLRYDVAANQLFGREFGEMPRNSRIYGEHDYTGCGIRIGLAGCGSVRESAGLFLQYADAFADPAPRGKMSPLSDPELVRLVGPNQARRYRTPAIRAIPLPLMAAPWEMLQFYDPNFASLCAGTPKTVLFLILAFYFLSELNFGSVGPGGIFEKRGVVRRWTGWTIVFLGIGLFVVVLCVEGRETESELWRLVPLILAIIATGSIMYCLLAMNGNTLSQKFLDLDALHRHQRLLPFGLGAVCLFAADVWALKYSVFQLALRFDLGSVLRGTLQTGLLLLTAYLLIQVASWLYGFKRLRQPNDAAGEGQSAEPADRASTYKEFARALALLLPPVAIPLLDWVSKS